MLSKTFVFQFMIDRRAQSQELFSCIHKKIQYEVGRYQVLLVSSSDPLSLWCLLQHWRCMVQFPNLKRIMNSRIIVPFGRHLWLAPLHKRHTPWLPPSSPLPLTWSEP